MDNLGFLFAANVVVWGGIFFYVFSLHKRSQSLEKDLELLKEIIDGETGK